ncbi:MAG TPA: HD domain-containing phosphohydrolase [Azospirillum sp.]|nr:HD domain-containing phosphohydrolase [Azospirillum sp.]
MTSSSDCAGAAMNVVVVDDSRSSIAHLTRLVQSVPGCAPHPFLSSARALEWCLRHEPDLVLLDHEMPPPDGLTFLEAFRAEHAEVPVVMVTNCTEQALRHAALNLGATDFLNKPVDECEFLARVRNLLKLRRSHLSLCSRSEWLDAEVRKATRSLALRERETILFLSRAAERRDPETGGHLVRMAAYAGLIAEALGLPAAEADLIHAAAPMHDVGKIGIPDHILLKPGRLDPEERRVMQQHPAIGHEILDGSSSVLLQVAAEIAFCHHERWDGSGYPRALSGEAIPLPGRITALADVFDALTSVRPYKAAWPLDAAYEYVVQNRGRHFDPACVDALLARREDVPAVMAGENRREDARGPLPRSLSL